MPLKGLDDQFRLSARSARVVSGRARALLHRFTRGLPGLSGPVADRLTVAPQDIRTSDPTVAGDIYAGTYVFFGQMVDCGGRSPFDVAAPSEEWARALHGFGWLRHLRAADTPIARHNARALVDDWLRRSRSLGPNAWADEVVARRIMAWLSQAPMLLDGCDAGFYKRFLKGLTQQVRFLIKRAGDEPDGLPRLKSAIAVVAAASVIENFSRLGKTATRRLDEELKRQILPDGGHVSRNPVAVLEILIDLLPVRQVLSARGLPVSAVVMSAIDRMMPMLRFFRHGDGSFALFNGVGLTQSDLVATVLVYDDTRGRPHGNAPHSGYQRLEAGRTVVIMDTGKPPPFAVSHGAHAGCLSFEFSSGQNRFVTNCGTPARPLPVWRRMARTTAAHSTLGIADRSSCVFLDEASWGGLLGAAIVAGPAEISVERQEDGGTTTVFASHDGYRQAFGRQHQRTIRLSTHGERIDGRDRLVGQKRAPEVPYSIRFHLHPSIRVSPTADDTVILQAPDGETWTFRAEGAPIDIEESVFLADHHGVRRTSQIVLAGRAGPLVEVLWTFDRTVNAHSPRRA